MTEAPLARGTRRAGTVVRMLDAAVAVLGEHGAAALSVQRVAAAAGTSKALVHYHFAGKDALLIACIERLAMQLSAVDEDALATSQPGTALSDLWAAMMAPQVRGWRRALLSLTTDVTPATAPALADVAMRRHRAAAHALARLEALLGFAPPIPRGTLAVAYVALLDGLTLDCPADAGSRQRQAFDAFWLAVLSLDV